MTYVVVRDFARTDAEILAGLARSGVSTVHVTHGRRGASLRAHSGVAVVVDAGCEIWPPCERWTPA